MGQSLSQAAMERRKSVSRRLSSFRISRKEPEHVSRRFTQSFDDLGPIFQKRSQRSRFKDIRKVLNDRDRALICQSWAQMSARGAAYQEQMLLKTWLRASAYSPQWVWDSLAGVEEGESETSAAANPRFHHIVAQVLNFLNLLITVHRLDIDVVAEECRSLGRRHADYFPLGFQTSYWDSFSTSMMEGVEAALLHGVEDAPSTDAEDEAWRTLYAWQKFIRLVVDQMRCACAQEMERRQEAAGDPSPTDPAHLDTLPASPKSLKVPSLCVRESFQESKSEELEAGTSGEGRPEPPASLSLRPETAEGSRHSSCGSRGGLSVGGAVTPTRVDALRRREGSNSSSAKNSRCSSHSSAHSSGDGGINSARTKAQRRSLYQNDSLSLEDA